MQNRYKVALFTRGCGQIRASYGSYLDCQCWWSGHTESSNWYWEAAPPKSEMVTCFISSQFTILTTLSLSRIQLWMTFIGKFERCALCREKRFLRLWCSRVFSLLYNTWTDYNSLKSLWEKFVQALMGLKLAYLYMPSAAEKILSDFASFQFLYDSIVLHSVPEWL
jgi:hypothetical protein